MERKELEQKVISVIDQLKPYLEADGGTLSFVELSDDNIVKVSLAGACATCAYRNETLRNGVEANMIKAIPEIKGVIAV